MADKQAERTTVLAVDDDGDIRMALEMMLQYEGYEVWTAKDGAEALARLDQEERDGKHAAIVLTDLKMPKLDGLQLLEAVMQRPRRPAVIMVSGHGDVGTAVEALRLGAVDFIEKPLDQNRVLVSIGNALREQRLKSENKGLRSQLTQNWKLVGKSPAMRKLGEQIARIAASGSSGASVLITGENGTGKEVVARQIHIQSPRAAGALVTVNCAASPAELIESELFGHEKGSFTGAHERRIGHFEAAHGGTLVLDEIGDMPLPAQAKVLRALETHEVTRVGGSESIPVDIRTLAATNANLTQSVEDKTFWLDLFYRLNVVPLRIPSLRERLEDVPLLAAHFLDEIGRRSGRAAPKLAAEGASYLAALEWPGNVRQLRNVLEGACVFAQGPTIERADLEGILADGPGLTAAPGAELAPASDPFGAATFEEFKDRSETLFFKRKLEANNGNVKRTAEELGMQRSHLYKKLDRYGLR
jgi:two-component system nitrogen regulation response regulator NtrX